MKGIVVQGSKHEVSEIVSLCKIEKNKLTYRWSHTPKNRQKSKGFKLEILKE